jgi:hypothetical protein
MKKPVALSGFDASSTTIHLKETSLVDVKQKVPSWKDIQAALENGTPLHDIKGKKELFFYKNFIPIPHALVKSFLELSEFDPASIAQVFYHIMIVKATKTTSNSTLHKDDLDQANSPSSIDKISNDDEETSQDLNDDAATSNKDPKITPVTRNHQEDPNLKRIRTLPVSSSLSPWLLELQHVLYFCYLCSTNKMTYIIYTIQNSPDVTSWQASLESVHLFGPSHTCSSIPLTTLTSNRSASVDEDAIIVESQISLKDHYMIHTLSKISENLDQNTLRIAKECQTGMAQMFIYI